MTLKCIGLILAALEACVVAVNPLVSFSSISSSPRHSTTVAEGVLP